MAFMNLLVFLNTYSDSKGSNAPTLSNFKWSRAINGISVNNPISQALTIPPGGSVTVFSAASKKFIYVESDQQANLTINGAAAPLTVQPFVVNTSTFPGQFMLNGSITSLVITNPSAVAANVFVASAE